MSSFRLERRHRRNGDARAAARALGDEGSIRPSGRTVAMSPAVGAVAFVCPLTKQPLTWVGRAELLERAADPSRVRNEATGAYVSKAAGLAFPVENGINVFLATEAVSLGRDSQLRQISKAQPTARSVRAWYDGYGWLKNEKGVYHDSAVFSFCELNAARRYAILSHLSLTDRLGSGELLLDAASGPIANSEYLTYSLFFERRVCVDFSRTALVEAQRKLGDHGVYVLADICSLPFPADTFDAIVSAYTIQHIDQADQLQAVYELYRVLKPERHLLIVGNNGSPIKRVAHRAGHRLARTCSRLRRPLSGRSDAALAQRPAITAAEAPFPLYGHTRSVGWWKRATAGLEARVRVEALRLFSKKEIMALLRRRPDAVRTVRALEALCPRLLAPVSFFLLIDIHKNARL